MKKITSLIAVFFSIVTIAQAQDKTDSAGHLSFKGVPIDGTLEAFISKMKKSGFIHKFTKDGTALLQGEFATYKNCIVGVSTLKKKDLVSKIAVLFPDCETWPPLSSNYFNLKELLTEKYGSPSNSVEEFQSSTPDSDGSKMLDAQLGHCKYYTIYETEKGTIELSIERTEEMHCFVKLAYFDKINSEKVKKAALDDL